jgi:hypothetical protein
MDAQCVRRSVLALRALRGLLALACCCACALAHAQAESPPPTVSPQFFGFDIPTGKLSSGGGRNVLIRDDEGQDVIARVHVEVGGNFIVMLPDGRLLARRRDETRPTEKPFTAITKEALAERLLAEEFKGFRSKQTNRYLYIYQTSDAYTLATSRILETMLPGVMAYAEAQKIEVHQPEVPLVVVMYRDEAEYRRATKAPPGMIAFYNAVDNRVSLYEHGRLAEARPDLAVQQALATIAHEGAHQILHNIGVQQRLSVWPMWLAEGMAEFFAPTSTDDRLKWKGAGQVNDMRMFELEQYFKARPADDEGELIADTVQAARLTSTGYATSWILTHYLAKHQRAEFHKYVNEISRLGPLEGDLRIVKPGIVPGNKTLFEKHFRDDYSAMEKRIVAHLNKQPYNDPFAGSPHVVAMIVVPSGSRTRRDANIFRSRELAEKWQRETLDRLPENTRASAALTMRVLPNKTAAQQFASEWVRQ